MHIGIDGSRCGEREATGVERYSQLLVPKLIKELLHRGHRVTVYARKNSQLFDGARVRTASLRFFWTQIFLGTMAQKNKVDHLFVPSHVLPFFRPRHCTVFVHDICWEDFADVYSFIGRWYLRLTTGDATMNANVITHSKYTEEKIKNIYGVKNIFTVVPAAMPIENVAKKSPFSWKKPYLLYVGRIDKKKNISLLISAFDELLTRRPDLTHNLVLLGKGGYGEKEIMETNKDLIHKDRIIFSGYVSDELRDLAIREASGIVLPSICEGAGLVLLEARTARVPFASSDCCPCVESGGSKGIYADANNLSAWVKALEKLIENPLTPDPPPQRNWTDVAKEIADILTTGNKKIRRAL
jgi:glycosyltransferase involved in cell wall biosynthesis